MENKKNIKLETESKNKVGLLSVLAPYKGIVALLAFIALAASSINLLIPKIIASAIDAFSLGDFNPQKVITQFLIASTGIFIFTALQGVIQTYTAERVARDLRKKIINKLSQQSSSFIIGSNPSRLLTNLTSDMDSVKTFVDRKSVV